MSERVMVVTGAFATHTTKLYNYYVCPTNWDFKDVEYLAVNYINQLYYLGKIVGEPINCHYDGNRRIRGVGRLRQEIKVDLQEFRCMLDSGEFQLVRLEPIIGGCNHLNLQYRRRGAFVESHRYFQNLAEFFESHQRLID
jgi:hypothetical protein